MKKKLTIIYNHAYAYILACPLQPGMFNMTPTLGCHTELSRSMRGRLNYSLLFFFLFSFTSFAQILQPKISEHFNSDPVFNSEFIKKHKIKSITADIVVKPDYKIIEDKGIVKGFEFDTLGNITRQYSSVIIGSTERAFTVPPLKRRGKIVRRAYTQTEVIHFYDTTETRFYYDKLNRLKIKRSKEGQVYNAWYYEYDSLNNIIKETRTKETSISENPKEFNMGVQTIISVETFRYERLSPTQIKKICLNDEGRIYKYIIINYDFKGNVIEENHEFIVSSILNNFKYSYTDKGILKEKIHKTNMSGELTEKIVYGYEKGNLVSEQRFKNDTQLNEISYLYDENREQVRSKVNRNYPDKNIEIVKYSYELYLPARVGAGEF